MTKANIKFFDINKFGFYLRGATENSFSGTHDCLLKLFNWTQDGREFVNTVTYSPDKDKDIFNTYFCDWYSDSKTKDSILILWNEVQNDNGVIYGMRPMSKPGDTSMLTTSFEKPAIPGMPSYYWFIPESNMVASLRFEHSVVGKSNLERYLNSFLSNKSPYRVLDKDGTVIGFSPDGLVSEESSKTHSKFLITSRKNRQLVDELIANRSIITRFLKRQSLSYERSDDRGVIEKFFSGLVENTPTFTEEKTINQIIEFKPNENQIRQIVKSYDDLSVDSHIKDLGFIYNTGETVMLSGVNLSAEIELGVNRLDNEIFSANILLNAILKDRKRLLNIAQLN